MTSEASYHNSMGVPYFFNMFFMCSYRSLKGENPTSKIVVHWKEISRRERSQSLYPTKSKCEVKPIKSSHVDAEAWKAPATLKQNIALFQWTTWQMLYQSNTSISETPPWNLSPKRIYLEGWREESKQENRDEAEHLIIPWTRCRRKEQGTHCRICSCRIPPPMWSRRASPFSCISWKFDKISNKTREEEGEEEEKLNGNREDKIHSKSKRVNEQDAAGSEAPTGGRWGWQGSSVWFSSRITSEGERRAAEPMETDERELHATALHVK